MARARSSRMSERVNPRSVAMEPKLRIRRGVLSLSHDFHDHDDVFCEGVVLATKAAFSDCSIAVVVTDFLGGSMNDLGTPSGCAGMRFNCGGSDCCLCLGTIGRR